MIAPSGWRTTCLGDVADVVGGGTPSASDSTLWGTDVPWLTPKDLSRRPARYTDGGLRSLSKEGLRKSSARVLPPGAVLVSSRAPIGLVTIARRALATSQGFRSLILSGGNVPEFFYYLLGASTGLLEARANGSTFKEISGSSLKLVEVSLPTISEQRGIAATLGSLDDKIESNRRCMSLLVQLAQAQLVGGTERVLLRDVATLDKGVSYKGSGLEEGGSTSAPPLINLGNFPIGSSWLNRSRLKYYSGDYRERHVVRAGDLVVANTDLTQQRAVLGRAVLVPDGLGPSLISHHVFAVRFQARDDLRLPLWAQLAGAKARDRLIGYATGTTVAGLPKEALLDFEVSVPASSDAVANAEALVATAWAKEGEAFALAALRDALLPELLSGRIRPPEAREAVETVEQRATAHAQAYAGIHGDDGPGVRGDASAGGGAGQ